jgi:site-specific recombinase XerD
LWHQEKENHPYSTSHLCKTVALENDMPLEVVSKTLGHSSIKMTQRYARTTENLIKKNMQKIVDMY